MILAVCVSSPDTAEDVKINEANRKAEIEKEKVKEGKKGEVVDCRYIPVGSENPYDTEMSPIECLQFQRMKLLETKGKATAEEAKVIVKETYEYKNSQAYKDHRKKQGV